MPFAGYSDFSACTHANHDKDDPNAYCGAIKHEVEDKSADGLAVYKAHAILRGVITKATTESGQNVEDMMAGDKEEKPGMGLGDVASVAEEIGPLLALSTEHDPITELLQALGASDAEVMDLGGGDMAIVATIGKKLDSVIQKAGPGGESWKPFQGPRGGVGAYNPHTQQVEYGENADRRIRMETSGRKVENPYVDLTELAAALIRGTMQPQDLDQSQLLAIYNHVDSTIGLGGDEPGYQALKDNLASEIQTRGLSPSVQQE